MLGDPYGVTFPIAVIGVLIARWVLKRIDEDQPAALAASSLGLCALLLWMMIDLVLWYGIDYHFSLVEVIGRLLSR